MATDSLCQFKKVAATRLLPESSTEGVNEPRGISNARELWNLTTSFQIT